MKLILHKCGQSGSDKSQTCLALSWLKDQRCDGVEIDLSIEDLSSGNSSIINSRIIKLMHEYSNKRKYLLLDLKSNNTTLIEPLSVLLEEASSISSQYIIFTSFDHVVIKAIKDCYPTLNTSILITANLVNMDEYILDTKCTHVHIEKGYLSEKLRQFLRGNEIDIIIANLQSINDIEEYKDIGVPLGIVYDYCT